MGGNNGPVVPINRASLAAACPSSSSICVCVCVLNYRSWVRCTGVRPPAASHHHHHSASLQIPGWNIRCFLARSRPPSRCPRKALIWPPLCPDLAWPRLLPIRAGPLINLTTSLPLCAALESSASSEKCLLVANMQIPSVTTTVSPLLYFAVTEFAWPLVVERMICFSGTTCRLFKGNPEGCFTQILASDLYTYFLLWINRHLFAKVLIFFPHAVMFFFQHCNAFFS